METFLILAKQTNGEASVQLIRDCLDTPGIYRFSELLYLPNIAELKNHTDLSGYYRLLEVFSFGDISKYKAAMDLPPLSARQLVKLQQLSILRYASTQRVLRYADLLKQLESPSVYELESLLINLLDHGALVAKLDQRHGFVHVQSVAGRDVDADQLDGMLNKLDGWLASTEKALEKLDSRIKWASEAAASEQERRQQEEQMVMELMQQMEKPGEEMRETSYKSPEYQDEQYRQSLNKRFRRSIQHQQQGFDDDD